MELDIFLPLAMREAGIKPSRLEMTKWAISSGKVARANLDIATARMKLLPTCQGCFTESGIKLLRFDTGEKRVFIEPLRYVSRHPWIQQQMELARRGGKLAKDFFDAKFKYDPFSLRQIYIFEPDQYGLIPLDLKISDPDLPVVGSIYDVIDIQDQDGVDKYFIADRQDRVRSRIESAQDETNRLSELAYQNEISRLAKPPSKAELIKDKRENRTQEETVLRDGMPFFLDPDDQKLIEECSKETINSSKSEELLQETVQERGEKNALLAQVIKQRHEKNDV